MEKSEMVHVQFDRNGVASVDTAKLTDTPEVRRQYEIGRKIVAAHRKAAAERRKSVVRSRR